MHVRCLIAAALLFTLTSLAPAQSIDEMDVGHRLVPRSTAHPGLLKTGVPFREDGALQAPNFSMMPRTWYLEMRAQQSPRFSGNCLDCGDPVVLVNHTHCSRCDARWWTSGAKGWDFPLER